MTEQRERIDTGSAPAKDWRRAMAASKSTWGGWLLFGAFLLGLTGAFNIIQGITALTKPDNVFVVGEAGLLVFNFTTWGWIMLVLGVLMILTALGLNGARGWARITAMVLIGLHALAQIGFISAHPLWSVLVIGLSVVVIYALTVRWDEAVAGLDETPEYDHAAGRAAPPPPR
jgi:hypothetical protein